MSTNTATTNTRTVNMANANIVRGQNTFALFRSVAVAELRFAAALQGLVLLHPTDASGVHGWTISFDTSTGNPVLVTVVCNTVPLNGLSGHPTAHYVGIPLFGSLPCTLGSLKVDIPDRYLRRVRHDVIVEPITS